MKHFHKTGWTSDTHDRRHKRADYPIAGAHTFRLSPVIRGTRPIVKGQGRGRWNNQTPGAFGKTKCWLRKAWRILKRIRKIADYI